MLLEPFVSQVIGVYLGFDEVPGVLTWIAMIVIIIALNTLEKGSTKKQEEIDHEMETMYSDNYELMSNVEDERIDSTLKTNKVIWEIYDENHALNGKARKNSIDFKNTADKLKEKTMMSPDKVFEDQC